METLDQPRVSTSSSFLCPERVKVTGAHASTFAEILTPSALAFVAALHRHFEPRRQELLKLRQLRRAEYAAGKLPDFLPETQSLRQSDWQVAPLPDDLQDRRVEITGPTERKMIINALNSGAKVFMADCEDSSAPTWENVVHGQINLRDAVRRTIALETPAKTYRLKEKTATLLVRPRGWHLNEKHVLVDGEPVSGALFDFGLYFFHNAHELLARGTGPYFYLPKLESHLEARLWNEVFELAQWELKIPKGTIKATVLIETLPAAFETNEILWELRQHSAGLNCGRWDYIFSYIKTVGAQPEYRLPDRSQVTMTVPNMAAYVRLVIDTCHRRGVHAMGGMAAQIPIKDNQAENAIALDKVHTDKLREARLGHDGTWVAHPALVPIALEVFDELMPGPNQIDKPRSTEPLPTAAELLQAPQGTITEAGLRQNLDVALRYLGAWIGGNGCVPLYNLMEDAATAEISRVQVWQWLHTPGTELADGRAVTAELYRALLKDVVDKLRQEVEEETYVEHYRPAVQLLDRLVTADECADFLTLPAYELLP
ncbi:malate synthase A [Hymenobacter busanensis]|uniref:Malate synthase n=1 Tax=Hymenobacter busanensis TaxID=2607656 RepID=A0A7L5A0H5_9BACT|nr:malate synthase A [Hymenobacter busanensis]KAA9338287.1 malate synthase A [Hymenobacter busanensis]QHJ09289.1 malate synthase A [Hymenobacter busanensis]